MRFTVNDFTIYYDKYGDGEKNILILPGWGDNRISFSYLINVLKEKYTVYIIDYPGFGKSLFPNRDLCLSDYTTLIKDFIIIKGINKPIIIAHSFGGRIVIDLFKKYRNEINVNHLILMDIAGIKPKQTLKLKLKLQTYKLLKRLKRILPNKLKERYINFLIKIFGSSDYSSLTPNIRNTFIKIINYDQKQEIKNITADTLIIWGEKDEDVPIDDAYFINKEIKDSGLVIIPKSGHFPYVDRAYYVNKVILEYLKEIK